MSSHGELNFNSQYDEKYRGPSTIESFTDRDLNRGLCRMDESEQREFTSQSSSSDGFWRPRCKLRDRVDQIRASAPTYPPKSAMTWHEIINNPKYSE